MYLAPLVFVSLLKLEIISRHMAKIRFNEFVFIKVSRLRVTDMAVMFSLLLLNKYERKTTGLDSVRERRGRELRTLPYLYKEANQTVKSHVWNDGEREREREREKAR